MTESVSHNVSTANITQTPGVCGGEPCINGRRIKVRHIYVWYELMGMTPDQIANKHNLTLAHVHAALSYAYDHLAEIRAAMHEEDEFVEMFKKEYPRIIQITRKDR